MHSSIDEVISMLALRSIFCSPKTDTSVSPKPDCISDLNLSQVHKQLACRADRHKPDNKTKIAAASSPHTSKFMALLGSCKIPSK